MRCLMNGSQLVCTHWHREQSLADAGIRSPERSAHGLITKPITSKFRFWQDFSLFYCLNKSNLVHNFSWYVYFFSLHVSVDYLRIIKRNSRLYVTLGICHSVWMTVWYVGCTMSTRQSSVQCDKYQSSHTNSYFSWWWAHNRPKHVERTNKRTKKNCEPIWFFINTITHGCRSTKHKIYLFYWVPAGKCTDGPFKQTMVFPASFTDIQLCV